MKIRRTLKRWTPVVIDLSSLGAGFTVKSATVFDGTNEIPSQLDDMNGDTRADELAFVINLPASGKKTLNVILSSLKSDKTYPARVYAEMLFRTSKKNKYAKGYASTVFSLLKQSKAVIQVRKQTKQIHASYL